MNPHPADLTPNEAIVYASFCTAAEAGQVCPLNLDLEMLIGCNSGSVVPTIVAKLEKRGLIKVRCFQKFRWVMIIATGQWTARDPRQQSEKPHVARGQKLVEVGHAT